MNNKYLAFDIETSEVIPENTNWKSHRPLGIACAATLLADSNEVMVWQGAADRLTQPEAAGLVNYLRNMVSEGYTILTWNGTGFDFDILAEESGMLAECRELTVSHVDMMFHILCRLGFGVSLNSAAQGMGLPGKPEGMNGALAPVLWAEGQRNVVLDYVAQDVRTTLALAIECENQRALRWITKSGKARTMRLPSGWLTQEQAERLPQPNTAWMTEPWKRSDFTGWMG
jgi:hypothetical protein